MASPRWVVTIACAASAALAACSSDTAILLRVTRDGSAPAVVPRLHIAIGVRAPGDVVAPAADDPPGATEPTYVDDTPSGELVDTSAVDLADAPFEVMLRPSPIYPLETGLQIAVIGYDAGGADGDVLAFGAIDHEVHFRRGETLIDEVTLAAAGDPSADPGRRACSTLTGGGGAIYACPRGCVRFDRAGAPVWIGAHGDVDCDGDAHGTDCDDLDWTVNHLATDVCGNGKNDDCAGGVDDGLDRDGDGLTPCAGDCVDNPAVAGSKDIHAGAIDQPGNGIDDDCSGACDELDDVDGDTYTRSGFRTTPPSAVDRTCAAATRDCNDLVGTIHPHAAELDGNGFDDDCDGTCDVDADGDGYTAGDGVAGVREPPDALTAQCPASVADCNDDPNAPENGTPADQIHPNAPELCDAADDNCNGTCDEGFDVDFDHFTVCGTVNDAGTACVYAGAPVCAGNGAACDCAEGKGLIFPGGPAAELCDGLDSACDGVRFPPDTTCFGADAQAACKVGTRTCDDTAPGGSFGACALSTVSAPPEACSQFGSCAGDPDPLACVAKKINNATRLGCQVGLDKNVAPPPLCPVPPSSYVVLLPPVSGSVACGQVDWTILGGEQHGAWRVGLTDAANTSTPAANVTGQCQTNLVVTAVGGAPGATQPPPSTTLLILVRRGGNVSPVVIDLAGQPIGACPDGPAMQCHTSG
jgi:hypothetical protein